MCNNYYAEGICYSAFYCTSFMLILCWYRAVAIHIFVYAFDTIRTSVSLWWRATVAQRLATGWKSEGS
jgi:hypothetical protein